MRDEVTDEDPAGLRETGREKTANKAKDARNAVRAIFVMPSSSSAGAQIPNPD